MADSTEAQAPKHTPGPWTWKITPWGSTVLIEADRDPVDRPFVIDADPSGGEFGWAIEPDSADAKLIAAAPEMLAALKRAAPYVHDFAPMVNSAEDWQFVKAAIAKAEQ